MKLTQKQTELINRAKELEKEYGAGNVFLRYINDFWRLCFVVHRKGENTYQPLYHEGVINRKVINSLQKKGLTTGCDNMHNEDADPNGWRTQPEGWYYVGLRLKTECI